MILLLAQAAMAAPFNVQAGGLGRATSVVALVYDGDQTVTAGCRDDGTGADAHADGIWTCAPVDVAAGPVDVALVVDGALTELGALTAAADGTALQVRRQGAALQSSTSGALLEPVPLDRPVPAGVLLLLQVSAPTADGVPVVRLTTASGSTQLACRDDGAFPDTERNDALQGCAGAAPPGPVRLSLHGAHAAPVDLGEVVLSGDAPVVVLAVDAAARQVRVADVALPWPAAVEEIPPDTVPTPPEPPEQHAPQDQSHAPPPPQPGPGPSPSPPPQANEPGLRLVHGAIALMAGLGGFGVAWWLGRRPLRLPQGLERLPSAPLWPGGPSADGGAALVECADLGAAAVGAVELLSRDHRVLVVGGSGLELQASAGAVFRSTATDWEQVALHTRTLVRAAGPPLVVLVIGRGVLDAPGAVAGDATQALVADLEDTCWVVVLAAPGAADLAGAARHTLPDPAPFA